MYIFLYQRPIIYFTERYVTLKSGTHLFSRAIHERNRCHWFTSTSQTLRL